MNTTYIRMSPKGGSFLTHLGTRVIRGATVLDLLHQLPSNQPVSWRGNRFTSVQDAISWHRYDRYVNKCMRREPVRNLYVMNATGVQMSDLYRLRLLGAETFSRFYDKIITKSRGLRTEKRSQQVAFFTSKRKLGAAQRFRNAGLFGHGPDGQFDVAIREYAERPTNANLVMCVLTAPPTASRLTYRMAA